MNVAAKILENKVYGVQTSDPVTRVAACALMAAASLTALWWPVRRAAAESPMEILKEG